MPEYRRAFVPGGTWFFTVNLLDRRSRMLTDHIDVLRAAVRATRARFAFSIDAMVVLPDHLHCLWTLPEGDADFPLRWRQIKARFSRSLPPLETRSRSRAVRGERGIWQRRYWEHLIRNERDRLHHVHYCWFNPVKHGLVRNVEDWPFSSFHREHRDAPAPGTFEATLAEHARLTREMSFGERSDPHRRVQ